MRWSEEEYQEFMKKSGKNKTEDKPKKSKYNAKKTRISGILFDSTKESAYYQSLVMLQKIGEVKGFCRQPVFVLQEGDETESAITYRPDFIVWYADRVEIVDVKGYSKQGDWERTYKMFRIKYPELELKII